MLHYLVILIGFRFAESPSKKEDPNIENFPYEQASFTFEDTNGKLILNDFKVEKN